MISKEITHYSRDEWILVVHYFLDDQRCLLGLLGLLERQSAGFDVKLSQRVKAHDAVSRCQDPLLVDYAASTVVI